MKVLVLDVEPAFSSKKCDVKHTAFLWILERLFKKSRVV